MRAVQFRDQKWFFSKKGNFQGLRTGDDCCTEHECGMKPIQEAFGLDLRLEGLNRNLVAEVPEQLAFVSTDKFTGFIYRDWYPVSAEKSFKDLERYNYHDEPIIAWDEHSFAIMAPVGQKKYVKAVKALWNALQAKDVLLGGQFSNKFSGSGIGFYIVSKMPKEEMVQAHKALIKASEERWELGTAAEAEGFEEVLKMLREAGKEWFYLAPSRLRDDGKVQYHLNPMQQDKHRFGSVTIDDLRLWAKDQGPILLR